MVKTITNIRGTQGQLRACLRVQNFLGGAAGTTTTHGHAVSNGTSRNFANTPACCRRKSARL